MKTLKSSIAALLLVLAGAGCGPAADSIPAAQADPGAMAVYYPEVAEGAGDGQVYEYH
jgi:hypothetical protein